MESVDKQVSVKTQKQKPQPSEEAIKEVAAQLRRIGDQVNEEYTVKTSDVLVWIGVLAAVPILGAMKM